MSKSSCLVPILLTVILAGTGACQVSPTFEGLSASVAELEPDDRDRIQALEAQVERLQAALETSQDQVQGSQQIPGQLTKEEALARIERRAWGQLQKKLANPSSAVLEATSVEIRKNRWTKGYHALCAMDYRHRPSRWKVDFYTEHPLIPFYVNKYPGDFESGSEEILVDLTTAEAAVMAP